MNIATRLFSLRLSLGTLSLSCMLAGLAIAADPTQGASRKADLGDGVSLEVVYIPPGDFMMGSTPEEKAWATGIEGGAQPGTVRESYEGDKPRPMRVKDGFWMGRTEVTVGQFRRFATESGYVTDAEKPGGKTQCFNPKWDGYHLTTTITHPWSRCLARAGGIPTLPFRSKITFPSSA